MQFPMPKARRWLFAVAASLAALALRPLIHSAFGLEVPFILAFPAVLAAGWYGGLGPGLLAMVLCTAGNLALGAPAQPAASLGLHAVLRASLFVAASLLTLALAEQAHRARRALERRVEAVGELEAATRRAAALSAQLETARRQLQLYVEHTPAFGWLKDPEFRYLMVNESAAREFGVPASGWIGRTDFELFPEPVARETRAADQEALRENRVVVGETRSPASLPPQGAVSPSGRPVGTDD